MRVKMLIASAVLLASSHALAAGDAAKGQAAFAANCGFCHAVTPGQTLMGPSLVGVAGNPAAKVAGFTYTPALTGANLTWDDATMDQWLTNPMAMVPGTMMAFPGVADAATRADLIAYLNTLK